MSYVWIEFMITREAVEAIHQPGSADAAVEHFKALEPMKSGLERISEDDLRNYVKHGILYDSDPEEVDDMNRETLEDYLLWDAACTLGDDSEVTYEQGQTWAYCEVSF